MITVTRTEFKELKKELQKVVNSKGLRVALRDIHLVEIHASQVDQENMVYTNIMFKNTKLDKSYTLSYDTTDKDYKVSESPLKAVVIVKSEPVKLKVEMFAFTGMRIGKFDAVLQENLIEVITAQGNVLYFDAVSLREITENKDPRYYNYLQILA